LVGGPVTGANSFDVVSLDESSNAQEAKETQNLIARRRV
jgi:hypothetical protein